MPIKEIGLSYAKGCTQWVEENRKLNVRGAEGVLYIT